MNANREMNFPRGRFDGRRRPVIWAMLTAASLSLGAPGAFAAEAKIDPPAAQKAVTYSDLDLTRAEGAAVLYGRIRAAAKVVCSDLANRGLALGIPWRNCVKSAISTAVAKVDRPALESYHRSKAGKKESVRIVDSIGAPPVQAAK